MKNLTRQEMKDYLLTKFDCYANSTEVIPALSIDKVIEIMDNFGYLKPQKMTKSMKKQAEIFQFLKEKPYIKIYSVMQRFFWWNVIGAALALPILPLISAYREWRFIERQKDFEYSKCIAAFRIKDMWWKLIKTHYQSWYERFRLYKA